jgi:hypothetical protein
MPDIIRDLVIENKECGLEFKWKIPSFCSKPIVTYNFEIGDSVKKNY